MDGYNFVAHPQRGISVKNFRPDADVLEAQLALGQRLSNIAYQLRYEGYRSYDYIGDRPGGSYSDSYDAQANNRTAIVFKQGIPAATVRITVHDPASADSGDRKLPAMEIFSDEIKATMAALRPNGRRPRAAEIGRLVRSPAYAKDFAIVFALFRIAGYLILHADADVVFNAVRTHHMPMYRRFGFQQLEAPRQYPGLAFETGLMACFRPNFADARDNLPFLQGISTEDACYAGLIAGERVRLFGDAPNRAARREPAGMKTTP
ncbi:hypothetical protein AiwAL_07275 [Acidiphilium sp. AL]|uniref:N-acyl amino acid synthase FeeM catalytic core domain-containing protein n=1 Tax=Acidiphilium iwatense TaxID=768198 RepID=A0ABS9DVW3_9PROT|nr:MULTISPECIES: hypothetical protein [Acidiphilium]MCF3946310.1 hypothetical protein [Acidiphilium iwatense]MCU4159906.1 hypothetical protein [Acidiphilium sp. AL]